MKWMTTLSLLLSVSAFASERKGFDCRNGDDPYGGKLCVYVISQCFMEDCAAAAECALQKYAGNVSWDPIESSELIGTNSTNQSMSFDVNSESGNSKQTVTVEIGPDFYNRTVCKPVALKIER